MDTRHRRSSPFPCPSSSPHANRGPSKDGMPARPWPRARGRPGIVKGDGPRRALEQPRRPPSAPSARAIASGTAPRHRFTSGQPMLSGHLFDLRRSCSEEGARPRAAVGPEALQARPGTMLYASVSAAVGLRRGRTIALATPVVELTVKAKFRRTTALTPPRGRHNRREIPDRLAADAPAHRARRGKGVCRSREAKAPPGRDCQAMKSPQGQSCRRPSFFPLGRLGSSESAVIGRG